MTVKKSIKKNYTLIAGLGHGFSVFSISWKINSRTDVFKVHCDGQVVVDGNCKWIHYVRLGNEFIEAF